MQASDFAALVPACCSEVLDAMYFTSVVDAAAPVAPTDASDVLSFTLRFQGDVSGQFGVHLEQATARNLAANFLGEEERDVSTDEVAEVVGELSNMLCGAVMSRVGGEHTFALSHPEAAAPLAAFSDDQAFVSALATDAGTITVWVALEGVPCSQ